MKTQIVAALLIAGSTFTGLANAYTSRWYHPSTYPERYRKYLERDEMPPELKNLERLVKGTCAAAKMAAATGLVPQVQAVAQALSGVCVQMLPAINTLKKMVGDHQKTIDLLMTASIVGWRTAEGKLAGERFDPLGQYLADLEARSQREAVREQLDVLTTFARYFCAIAKFLPKKFGLSDICERMSAYIGDLEVRLATSAGLPPVMDMEAPVYQPEKILNYPFVEETVPAATPYKEWKEGFATGGWMPAHVGGAVGRDWY